MKTVPDTIIKIEKWAGDIEPFVVMEEAWFRIKGIPMRYRNKSTAYYVASMAGLPLTLDMNLLMNFAYIRVKLGCQDPALVPSSRIDSIKKGFYEFQFTREVIDPNTNPATYYASVVQNTNDDTQQNSPKRQRTGNEDALNAGGSNENTNTRGNDNRGGHTQGLQQKDLQDGVEKGKEVVVSSSSLSDTISDSFATRIQNAMNSHAAPVDNSGSSSVGIIMMENCN
jgi:hypothetical protein